MDTLALTQVRVLTSLTDGELYTGCIRMDPKSGTILEAGPDVTPRELDMTVALPGHLVTPGWVVGHTHLYSALARGMPAPRKTPSNFLETLQYLWWVLDRALDLETVYASGIAGLLSATRAGVTGVIDHHASPNCIPQSLSRLQKAFEETGLRGLLCYEVTDRNSPTEGSVGIAENCRFAAETARHPLVRGCMGAHASFTITDPTFDELARVCMDDGLPLHIHLLEDAADRTISVERFGADPVTRLQRRGLLRPIDILAHGVHLTPTELDLLADANVTLVHNPRSNMNNRVGRACIQRGRWQLGTDGIDNDIISEARTAFFRGREDNPPIHFPVPMQMMREAQKTLGQAFGLVLDEIRPEAGADLTILRYEEPTPLGAENFAGHLYFGLDTWAVVGTVVRGRFVLRDNRIVSCDETALMEVARTAARKMSRNMEVLS